MSATCDDVLLMEGSTNAPGTGNGSRHPGFFLNNERQKGCLKRRVHVIGQKKWQKGEREGWSERGSERERERERVREQLEPGEKEKKAFHPAP